jgi:hypothetical protein
MLGSSHTYTILTVAHATDYGLLELQARSLALYCPPQLVHEILIIENFDPGAAVDWRPTLLAAYGPLAPKVRFLGADTVCAMPQAVGGWWGQQAIKLAASRVVAAERYLILDAKNHCFRRLTRDFLETPDTGKPRLNGYGFEHHSLKDALIRTLGYYGIDATPFIPRFTRTSTPFLMLKSVAAEVVAYVEKREGKPFAEAFLDRKLTEFFAYSGYLQMRDKLQSTYSMDQPYCAQIWGYSANPTGCREAIARAVDPGGAPFLSVHRAALTEMNDEARRIVAEFWHTAKLFKSVEAGISFSKSPNAGLKG